MQHGMCPTQLYSLCSPFNPKLAPARDVFGVREQGYSRLAVCHAQATLRIVMSLRSTQSSYCLVGSVRACLTL